MWISLSCCVGQGRPLFDAIAEFVAWLCGQQIVDQQTLQEVKIIEFPVVLAVAARFGTVRLLDNMELQPPSPTPKDPNSTQRKSVQPAGPQLGHEICFF